MTLRRNHIWVSVIAPDPLAPITLERKAAYLAAAKVLRACAAESPYHPVLGTYKNRHYLATAAMLEAKAALL